MRKSIISAALFLGISAIGFSQARGKIISIDGEKITGAVSTVHNGHFGDGLHIWSSIIQNPNVTLTIGETVFIHPSGAIVKTNGEFVSQVVKVVSLEDDELRDAAFHGNGTIIGQAGG